MGAGRGGVMPTLADAVTTAALAEAMQTEPPRGGVAVNDSEPPVGVRSGESPMCHEAELQDVHRVPGGGGEGEYTGLAVTAVGSAIRACAGRCTDLAVTAVGSAIRAGACG